MDTREYFEKALPEKLKNDPSLAAGLGVVYQFDVSDVGTWTVDLTGAGLVHEGPCENPTCVITVGKEDWEQVVDDPRKATMLFMMGKIKTTHLGLAIKLQNLLA
jgi:hypothetical protein